MANEERVEDLLSAQSEILQSGSGGALAMPSATPPSPTSSMGSTGSLSSNSQQQAENVEVMPSEAATGTCADDASCQPVRLSLEWLSTRYMNENKINLTRLTFFFQAHKLIFVVVKFCLFSLLYAWVVLFNIPSIPYWLIYIFHTLLIPMSLIDLFT